MGVYIKGMEMPKSCIVCRLECLYRKHNSTERSSHCPLVEIAEPHGRLIDADAIDKEVGNRYMAIYESLGGIDLKTMCSPTGFVISELLTVEKMVLDAPTVIEAEGE